MAATGSSEWIIRAIVALGEVIVAIGNSVVIPLDDDGGFPAQAVVALVIVGFFGNTLGKDEPADCLLDRSTDGDHTVVAQDARLDVAERRCNPLAPSQDSTSTSSSSNNA